jgi:hypothetical protein
MAASNALLALDQLVRALPGERERLRPYLDRARAFSSECGCSLGGAFLTAALAGIVIYAVTGGFAGAAPLRAVLLTIAFLFAAGITGKLIGIAVARVRLALLCRELAARYPIPRG